MAAKFVVAVALFALCHANPAFINGVYRDGRAYSLGQAFNYGSGLSQAQATSNGAIAQASGISSNGQQLARDGFYYPGQAVAQALVGEAPENSVYGDAKAIAQAQNGAFYTIPKPATVITYEQNFAAPAESSVATASSNGDGIAKSSAVTRGGSGSYGLTSSDAKTTGSGSAGSQTNTRYGSTSTLAQTQGGSATSSAQINGIYGGDYIAAPVAPIAPVAPVAPSVPAQEIPAIYDAKSPIFYTPYVPITPVQEAASANANVFGNTGKAASSAKITHGRTISWRFGTLYDGPVAARTQANLQPGNGAARSSAQTNGFGSANANAGVNGYGNAQSSAASNGAGSANANAKVNGAGYGNVRYAAIPSQYYGGAISSDAQTQGSGSATSSARSGVNQRQTNSQASSGSFGSARANAYSA